jgi:hypothetical protein
MEAALGSHERHFTVGDAYAYFSPRTSTGPLFDQTDGGGLD